MFSQFEAIRDVVSVHLVEVSPKLSQMQKEKLSGKQNDPVTESRQVLTYALDSSFVLFLFCYKNLSRKNVFPRVYIMGIVLLTRHLFSGIFFVNQLPTKEVSVGFLTG